MNGLTKRLESIQTMIQTDEGKSFLQRIRYFTKVKLNPYENHTATRRATILDPRFKKVGFTQKLNANETEKALLDQIAVSRKANKTSKLHLVSEVLPEMKSKPKETSHPKPNDLLSFLSEEAGSGSDGFKGTPLSEAILLRGSM